MWRKILSATILECQKRKVTQTRKALKQYNFSTRCKSYEQSLKNLCIQIYQIKLTSLKIDKLIARLSRVQTKMCCCHLKKVYTWFLWKIFKFLFFFITQSFTYNFVVIYKCKQCYQLAVELSALIRALLRGILLIE